MPTIVQSGEMSGLPIAKPKSGAKAVPKAKATGPAKGEWLLDYNSTPQPHRRASGGEAGPHSLESPRKHGRSCARGEVKAQRQIPEPLELQLRNQFGDRQRSSSIRVITVPAEALRTTATVIASR